MAGWANENVSLHNKLMKLHPLCRAFPALKKRELRELADDIKQNGLREPVVCFQGQILDGQNRVAACKLAGVDVKVDEFNGDEASAMRYVVSKNLSRRHLTASQRAIAAAALTRIGKQHGGKSSREAARQMNVSKRSVAAARKVAKASRKLAAKVTAGDVTLGAAAELATMPKGKLQEALGESPEKLKKIAAQLRQQNRPRGGLAAPAAEPKIPTADFYTSAPAKMDEDPDGKCDLGPTGPYKPDFTAARNRIKALWATDKGKWSTMTENEFVDAKGEQIDALDYVLDRILEVLE